MATIKLPSLVEQPSKTRNGYLYRDLHLDFTPVYGKSPYGAYTQNNELLKEQEIVDIVADYDLGAIRNSLYNIFTTIPGQKILNPYFGLNLMQYVFEVCDEDIANLIGNQIVSGITTYEPRVTLNKVKVTAEPENQQYTINIFFSVPTLGNTSFNLVGILSTSGFNFT
ncbi:baseplate wedge subunit [uncultured Caudovirales phage]|uniref:Baseplate wedge subunit n=1 Tax=uncultured Caudovirales phage TaxID=2100421 RepID=A0A6J7X9D0_9CAUD|nr:baseplate wedge subunit [uncultured Caudovirales phage]